MILAYSTFVEDNEQLVEGGEQRRPINPSLFFSKRGVCPYCRIEVPAVFRDAHGPVPPDFSVNVGWGAVAVWACSAGGWWELQEDTGMELWEQSSSQTTLLHAILASFDPTSVSTPVSVMRSAVRKNPGLLHKIHPRKLEELVASIFSDFFACEVQHVGKSNDGGIDLVLVNSDSPTLVQVKRRQDPRPAESVATVREFLAGR